MKREIIISSVSAILLNSCIHNSDKQSESLKKGSDENKTNILVILADDLGYSDISCYGSEIRTPNIDQLGEKGIRFTQFYNASRCCPSRASLLTGLYPHNTGMGWLTAADLGEEGYTGDLNNQCVTIPQLLKQGGYVNYISGKWHVTNGKNTKGEDSQHNWPLQRGFDHFFGTIKGAGSYFNPSSLSLDNHEIEPPENFFYTDAISNTATPYIKYHKENNPLKPFFINFP